MLEKRVTDQGHILLMSPKGHPELAGLGIEYSWGKAKTEFRKKKNCVPKDLHANIVNALAEDVLFLLRVRKFARKTREYMRAYARLHGLNSEADRLDRRPSRCGKVREGVEDAPKHLRLRESVDNAWVVLQGARLSVVSTWCM